MTVDLRFTTPPHNHNAIEPHATTAVWEGDRLTAHDSTQSIDWLRTHLALPFDVPPANVRVLSSSWTGVFDFGRVINAKTAASQLRGGIIAGSAWPWARRPSSTPATEYHLPVQADIPQIDIECLDEPDPTMPMGLIGIGEVGPTGVAAAIANAVHHATGKRIYDLPITLDKLL